MKINSVVDNKGRTWSIDDYAVIPGHLFNWEFDWEGRIDSFKFDTDMSMLAVVIDQNDDAFDVNVDDLLEGVEWILMKIQL